VGGGGERGGGGGGGWYGAHSLREHVVVREMGVRAALVAGLLAGL